MRNASLQAVYELVKNDKNIVALTADDGNDVYTKIEKEYPNQYVNYGIAESNMIASAAGLASCGKMPIIYGITNFMSMRAFEFIRNDVCFEKYNVKFICRSSGLTSSNMGPTHQGTEEVALLRALPNMTVITASTPIEAKKAVFAMTKYDGPVYLRIERVNEKEFFNNDYNFVIGKGVEIIKGHDITVISMGSVIEEAISAAKILEAQNIFLRIINIHTVKPIDRDIIIKAVNETKGLITLEEHNIVGGLGSAVAEVVAENGKAIPFVRMGLRDEFCMSQGNRKEVRKNHQLLAEDIVNNVLKIMNKEMD